jgi:zinc and cadmium transporter
MLEVWIYTLVSVFLVSIASFAGLLVLTVKRHYLKAVLLFFVSFAAGAMLGDVFLHLLPELAHDGGVTRGVSLMILAGILGFFVLEKVVHWRHCHMSATPDHVHPLAVMNLVGDAVHNLIDGVLIAGSYLLSVPVGVATTVAVILHEIPQEMGDFGVLLHSGMRTRKALLFNFLTALTAILGAIIVLAIGVSSESAAHFIIPFTIGGFIYVANADLIPELHKEVKPSKSFFQLLSFLAGIGIMFLMLLGEGHEAAHGQAEPPEMYPPGMIDPMLELPYMYELPEMLEGDPNWPERHMP